MNFGHGELGLGACPSAKSNPVAEYCTVLSVSTPSAFDAFAMIVAASWAEALKVARAAIESAARISFFIQHQPFDRGSSA